MLRIWNDAKNVCVKTDRVEELVELGCFIQVNAGSVLGRYGFGTARLTRKMLGQGLVHFIATDA